MPTHLDTTLSAIIAIDTVLGIKRELLLTAIRENKPDDAAKVRAEIDVQLDQRLGLMSLRDELNAVKAKPRKAAK